MKKLRRWISAATHRSGSASIVLHVRKFSSKEIKKATDSFSMIIGRDSVGTVYRARFSDGRITTIKKVKQEYKDNLSFPTEVQLLARLHHCHLVKLVGFSEGHERFLAFEHMENGSLRDWLRDPLKTPLNWRTRLQIAIGVAAALVYSNDTLLEYIYYFCDPPVYNVTVNADNVMLDHNFVAKLSNVVVLGCSCNNEQISNGAHDQRNKDAVFQFGLLILELITGQSMGGEDEALRWVQGSGISCSMHKMVDADLGGNYDSRELKSLVITARLCTKVDDESAVSISQILRYLRGKIDSSN